MNGRKQSNCGLPFRNFSNGIPLDSIETEQSRVILKEVEPGWWILASIKLTQLPAASLPSSANLSSARSGRSTPSSDAPPSKNVEYSSREVTPAPLLLAQLVRAYRVFLLHHASSLSELWKRHEANKELFCSLLNRYWTRFVWNWDVLLHGNPAVELYNAIKLAGGGELGVGVGEEEWGSGEREVLEGFIGRTEGLVDIVVGRYGDAPAHTDDKAAKISHSRNDSLPWLGNGENSRAEDGIIFSGIGSVSKPSLTTISQWMESVYVQGEAAYGIGDNPTARLRHRRKRRKVDRESSRGHHPAQLRQEVNVERQRARSPAAKSQNLRRQAMENNATPPGIPPPLVSAVERSLDEAIANADASADRDQATAENGQSDSPQGSMFSTQKMMKYLSLGYGSSWTLNPKGFNADGSPQVENDADSANDEDKSHARDSPSDARLQELDPTPDISEDEEKPFVQRLEESIGKFLIGLSGDLENTEFEVESNDERADGITSDQATQRVETPKRIFLRTLVIEMSTSRFSQRASLDLLSMRAGKGDPEGGSSKGKTSAAASVDGAQPVITYEKVQVAVYVHQPFIFVFLFQLHTSNLTMPGFYRAIHHTLGPLQKSLLRSTDPERWRERMIESLGVDAGASSANGSDEKSVHDTKEVPEIYDLVFDPAKATIRTSIPNIPLPGSIAAEGLHRSSQNTRPITVSGSWYTLGIPIGSSSGGAIGSSGAATLVKSGWTRIESLNVHAQILNTWIATREKHAGWTNARPTHEVLERTVKTGRNWWIVWMKVVAAEQAASDQCAKEAVLVRRSSQDGRSSSRETSRSRSDTRSTSSTGKWLLREQPRSRIASGNSSAMATASTANAKGVSEGVGVDAKRWVKALLRLTV
jgi:hypothetical protein